MRAIQQGVKVLASRPEIGGQVEEMPPEFREWFIPFGGGGYVALYRYDGELVAMLAAPHGRLATELMRR